MYHMWLNQTYQVQGHNKLHYHQSRQPEDESKLPSQNPGLKEKTHREQS